MLPCACAHPDLANTGLAASAARGLPARIEDGCELCLGPGWGYIVAGTGGGISSVVACSQDLA